jgi:hypothetical protein
VFDSNVDAQVCRTPEEVNQPKAKDNGKSLSTLRFRHENAEIKR